jgi:hypothetical protein
MRMPSLGEHGSIATLHLSLLAIDYEEHENPSLQEMDEDAKLR